MKNPKSFNDEKIGLNWIIRMTFDKYHETISGILYIELLELVHIVFRTGIFYQHKIVVC